MGGRLTISLAMADHLRGRLQVFGLADLLQWMELNRCSGRLSLARGADRRMLDWIDGELIYVSGSLPRHRLGVHLLRSGSLPAEVLYELLARNLTGGANLTLQILEGRHDTQEGLSLRLDDLARRLLFEMFEWRDATEIAALYVRARGLRLHATDINVSSAAVNERSLANGRREVFVAVTFFFRTIQLACFRHTNFLSLGVGGRTRRPPLLVSCYRLLAGLG